MKDTKENRIKFLKENNAYEAFVENAKGDRELEPELEPKTDFISYAFSWENTPEGSEFWANLNDEYFSMID